MGKTFNSRIVHKHDTEANWKKATAFTPEQGEIIIYDIDSNYAYERFKIGDGNTLVNSLPFADAELRSQLEQLFAEKSDNGHIHTTDDITSGVFAVEYGGTGKSNIADARTAMNYIGAYPISSTDDDTTSNWIALGSGYAFVSKSGISNYPSNYVGFLYNYVSANFVYQELHVLTNWGTVYHRAGHKDDGWYGGGVWTKEFNSNDTISIENGGTNATTATGAVHNLMFKGTNPVADDNIATWRALGSGHIYIDQTDSVVTRPVNEFGAEIKYGVIDNIVMKNLVCQTWHTMNRENRTYYRAGNASGWYGGADNWVEFGTGSDSSIEIGSTEEIRCCRAFTEEMNRVANSIGMKNSSFISPSGLWANTTYKASETTAYNNYITAYDLLLLMIAARHTPTVFEIMGERSHYYTKNGLSGYYVNHIILNTFAWRDWANTNGYTILAAKGGSGHGTWNTGNDDSPDNCLNGVLNMGLIIQDNSDGNVYGVSLVGFQEPSDFKTDVTYITGSRARKEVKTDSLALYDESTSYSKYDLVKVNIGTSYYSYMSLVDNNVGNMFLSTDYTEVTSSDFLVDDNLPVLYELIGGEYSLTTDTAVDSSKTYYVHSSDTVHNTNYWATVGYVTYVKKSDTESYDLTNSQYWSKVIGEGTLLREAARDLINQLKSGNITEGNATATIKLLTGKETSENEPRKYPVGLAAVKLKVLDDYNISSTNPKPQSVLRFYDDTSLLDNGVYYNKDYIRPALSVSKILTAIVATSMLDNHYCSINSNDIVGGSGLDWYNGDKISMVDAMHIMLLCSDNTMATLLARDCGQRLDKKYLGNNPVFEDTPKNWIAVGSGHCYVNASDTVVTRPINENGVTTTAGVVINNVCGEFLVQEWHTPNNINRIYYRSGGLSSGWYDGVGAWVQSYNSNNTVPIINGGTGATTAAAALKNLGASPAGFGYDGTTLPSVFVTDATDTTTWITKADALLATLPGNSAMQIVTCDYGNGITANSYGILHKYSDTAAGFFGHGGNGLLRRRKSSGSWLDWEKTFGQTNIIPVKNGGTGASTAATAANALKVASLGGGTKINAEEDLNDFTTVGSYYCNYAPTAATLLNCPVTTYFTMYVGEHCPGATNYCYQEIIPANGTRWYRYSYPSNSDSTVRVWTDWDKSFDTNTTTPIENGGTGAKTAADALTNLGAYSSSGGDISGDVNITGNLWVHGDYSIIHASDPVNDNELANKGYVDSAISLAAESATEASNKYSDAQKVLIDSQLVVLTGHVGSTDNPHSVTCSQIGASPAGFGYDGTTLPSIFVYSDGANAGTTEDWATKADTMLATMPGNSAKQIVTYDPLNRLVTNAWGMLYKYNSTSGGFCGSSAYGIVLRRKVDGAWGEWMFQSPYLTASTEYCTIEKWKGKRVYTMLVSAGTLLSNATRSVEHGIENISSVIRCAGSTSDGWCLPYDDGSGTITIGADTTNVYTTANHPVITAANTLSNYKTAYVQIWYTKTT